ncbi:MAG: hypothetical protein QXP03_02745 [Desulfurococcaceae archaeon]
MKLSGASGRAPRIVKPAESRPWSLREPGYSYKENPNMIVNLDTVPSSHATNAEQGSRCPVLDW